MRSFDENYVPPHEHNYIDGICECGEADLEYLRSQAVADIQEYADLKIFDNTLTARYVQSVRQTLSNETLLINQKETAADIEIEATVACYRIDLIVLENNRDAAILALEN